MGGALTAVAPDFTRASLGVPAMHYSLLLPRSVDFDDFAPVLYPSYPNETRAAVDARPDPDALGPRRAERLRAPDDRQAPAGHAAAQGAHERRLRRPPGDQLPADVEARTIGAARSPDPLPGRWSGHQRALRHPLDPPLPLHRLGDLLLGHRPDPRRPGQPGDTIGTEPPPYETCRTASATTRTGHLARRRQSSSSSPTSSKARSDTAAASPPRDRVRRTLSEKGTPR